MISLYHDYINGYIRAIYWYAVVICSNTILAHIIKLAAASSYHLPFLYWLWEVEGSALGFRTFMASSNFWTSGGFFSARPRPFKPLNTQQMNQLIHLQSVHALNFWPLTFLISSKFHASAMKCASLYHTIITITVCLIYLKPDCRGLRWKIMELMEEQHFIFIILWCVLPLIFWATQTFQI